MIWQAPVSFSLLMLFAGDKWSDPHGTGIWLIGQPWDLLNLKDSEFNSIVSVFLEIF